MHPLLAIPGTLFLVIRSYRRKSLTPLGIVTATATAIVHAAYPSAIPFTLLVTFFMLGTTATKVKHEVKATLTVSSTGSSGGEGARTSTQVLANSGVASALILLHTWYYGFEGFTDSTCFGGRDIRKDLILLGIMSNYAAVTADTLSSELGILSRSKPRLITAPWKSVAPGTNGGVTVSGLLSGMAGSFVIGLVSVSLTNFCHLEAILIQMIGAHQPQQWTWQSRAALVALITAVGTFGTLLDSLLGALLQASVVDKRTGKVVEGAGGTKVLTAAATRRPSVHGASQEKLQLSRSIETGRDVLDNNQINALMAVLTTIAGVLVALVLEKSQHFLTRAGSS